MSMVFLTLCLIAFIFLSVIWGTSNAFNVALKVFFIFMVLLTVLNTLVVLFPNGVMLQSGVKIF